MCSGWAPCVAAVGVLFAAAIGMASCARDRVSSTVESGDGVARARATVQDTVDAGATRPASVDEVNARITALRQEFAKQPEDLGSHEWVKKKLALMEECDQLIRTSSMQVAMALMPTVDAEHTRELKRIIERHGWILAEKFGYEAAQTAWLIVQHSPDTALQKQVLAKMEQLVKEGRVDRGQYALLHDRVAALVDGVPQLYGTQGQCTAEGEWEALPIADVAHLDERRREMGLGPHVEYRLTMRAFCRQ